MRVLAVFGTRPEVIKMAPVLRAAKEAGIDAKVCVTAQHREMLDQMLEVFGIKADFDLDLMQENQSPLSVAPRVSIPLAPLMLPFQPIWLLFQGATTTPSAADSFGDSN